MKVLDSEDLVAGIDDTTKGLTQLKEQTDKIQKNIEELVGLEESFKGEGGQSIRSFYNEVHLPFLRNWKKTMEQYEEVLQQIIKSLQSFEPASQALIRQEFLDHEVTEGLHKAEQTTRDLTDEGNNIIQSVSDIVALPQLDDSRFMDQVKLAENHKEETIEDLHNFDRSGTNQLLPIEQDVAMLRRVVSEMNGMFQSGELVPAQYKTSQLMTKLLLSMPVSQVGRYLSQGLSAVTSKEEAENPKGVTPALTKEQEAVLAGNLPNGVPPVLSKKEEALIREYLLNGLAESDGKNSPSNYQYPANEPITFEDRRKVLGGLGTGTPDGLAGPASIAFNFFAEDVATILNPEASSEEKMMAFAFMFAKPAKLMDKMDDLAGGVGKSIKHGDDGTEKYNTDTMKHIYHGEINKRGKAVGYHHESMRGGKIIPGTEKKPDKNGIYVAKVEIDGVRKVADSSFFPKEWNRVDVLNAIDEAFRTKQQVGPNKYKGVTSSGIKVEMYLNKDGSIATAYPLYKK